jgi:hypothetical protein
MAATVILLGLAQAPVARALSLSPLNGTPDASPRSQISFLGAPPGEIRHVSVVGSRSGAHSGRLAAYATSAGASFLPSHPFLEGEQVTARAVVGSGKSRHAVATTFTIAHLSTYRASFGGGPAKPKGNILQSFVSQPGLKPPKIAISISSPGTSQGDVFITPTHGLGQSGAMIFDNGGRLVWYHPLPAGDIAANFQVQTYNGQPVLVWWQGHVPEKLGVGFGRDEIYSTSYTRIASITAGNGYQADLHDFQLTPQGSAFLTAYSLVDADLSRYGGTRDDALQDAILQEVDVPTGLVMFEWHADGHVALADSYTTPPHNGQPWDFFHLNSVSLDPWGDGDFIVSARNTWAAYEIDHHTGAVRWRLGGRHSSFRMGPGTGTAYQHDVRWQPDRTLTIFDNGAVPKVHSASRAIREHIDFKHGKVALVSRYVRGVLAGSQGNDQLLADGASFVGWGEAPYFTEYNSAGQIVFDGRIPFPGQSYRAFRFPWTATPAAAPSIAVRTSGPSSTVYASWNGATQVSSWQILGGPTPTSLAPVATVPFKGFETAATVPSGSAYFLAQALDAGGHVLANSPAVPR